MNQINFQQVYAAAKRAEQLYPGPVGELLSHELMTWADSTGRFGGHGRVYRLVEHLLDPAQTPR